MGINLYTSFQKYHCFWLENGGQLVHKSTYTQENTVNGTPIFFPTSYMSHIPMHRFSSTLTTIFDFGECVKKGVGRGGGGRMNVLAAKSVNKMG